MEDLIINPIFKQPYKFNEVERTLVQVRITKLLDASLVELSRGEYVSTIVMLTKKFTFLELDQTLHVWGFSCGQ